MLKLKILIYQILLKNIHKIHVLLHNKYESFHEISLIFHAFQGKTYSFRDKITSTPQKGSDCKNIKFLEDFEKKTLKDI